MSTLITNRARAYINFGRWVADCPSDCGSALQLQPGQTLFPCEECRRFAEIDWPDDPDGLWEALQRRPAPRNRNWFPSGHVLALKAGLPHGQSVQDLIDETAEHEG